MKENRYIKFTEYNDWEGEEWDFYILVNGNEKEIEKLRTLIDGDEYDEFTLTTTKSNNDVDILIANTKSGYMDFSNKLDGELDTTNIDFGKLYKGGIMNCFKK